MASKAEYLHLREGEILESVRISDNIGHDIILVFADSVWPDYTYYFFFHSRKDLLLSLSFLQAQVNREIKRLTGYREKENN